MASDKQIKENIRLRFIKAVDELKFNDSALSNDKIMKSIGDYQQAFTQMNSGSRYPTLENVVMICQVYGISANWLLFGIGSTGIEGAKNPLERIKSIEQELEILKLVLNSKAKKK